MECRVHADLEEKKFEVMHMSKDLELPYPPMKQACVEQSNHDPVFALWSP